MGDRPASGTEDSNQQGDERKTAKNRAPMMNLLEFQKFQRCPDQGPESEPELEHTDTGRCNLVANLDLLRNLYQH
ncbi:hypothetical protein PENANT_c005G05628 [Penicillium antarcticum]|uniref:Uncharacterized protein n=1 Tax=Penicillium antarcticum TaxID=416450 RepID=A0A1V6QEZ7_9EURO|nr:hypothetical protein PENANT_c005G05628 [Penicillium antarcticum]